jgi:tripartite-type tricarboxylate transporter receptor subunit TctC
LKACQFNAWRRVVDFSSARNYKNAIVRIDKKFGDSMRIFRTLATLCFSPLLFAQDPYPNHAITMVVPFPPGGVADTVARPVSEAMGRYLKQSVVVNNVAGAGGGIGMAQVAKAAPDGYTLLMALSSVVIIPEADKVLGRSPMYQLPQLIPIARFTADPTALVVRADSPWQTADAFIAHAKANPSKLSYGSSGNYGTMHIPMEQLKIASSANLLHVPYTGAGPAVTALLAGQIDALATGPASVTQHIKAGKLRALAHWGESPLATLPNVPTFKSLNVDINFSQWAGLFVPAGTPAAIVDKLKLAAKFAADDARVNQNLQSAGTSMQYLDQASFERFVAADAKVMAAVVQKIGKVE